MLNVLSVKPLPIVDYIKKVHKSTTNKLIYKAFIILYPYIGIVDKHYISSN
jgi:hypothetical protein